MPILLSKSQYVSVAHRYWDMRLSLEENIRIYGSLASLDGIGSNMRLELSSFNGSEANLEAPIAMAKKLLDHRRLFTEIDEFKTQASTLERVTAFLKRELRDMDIIRVEESERLACIVQKDSNAFQVEMKVMNLTLTFAGPLHENGLLIDRHQVTQAVMDEYRADGDPEGLSTRQWAEHLFGQLSKRVPVQQLRIDLGRQRYILVKSEG